MFSIYDIQKKADGIHFEKNLDVTEHLKARNPEILDLTPIFVRGSVRFEAGFYFLDYDMSYTITLPSSRSLEPVEKAETVSVSEIFVADEALLMDNDVTDKDLVLIAEDEVIRLDDSIADNILLAIPLKILTPEEEANPTLLSGKDWTVLTENDFQKSQREKKTASHPFAQLQALFDDQK